jgi:glucose-1-phosphate thymidylyltransferase
MKGIILAGGNGTRLYPTTRGVNKHLLPIYDKPMIYYPLTTLMLAGIKEVIIVQRPEEEKSGAFHNLFGNGSQFGMDIHYTVQPMPTGIAGVFHLSSVKEYIGDEPCCLILGDNVFYGHGLPKLLEEAKEAVANRLGSDCRGAVCFGYQVKDPERYGVLDIKWVGGGLAGVVKGIEEKPKHPKSNYAVPGIYIYGSGKEVVARANQLKQSARHEYEITDLNRLYLNTDDLSVKLMPRGIAWLDTGTPQAMQQASNYVQAVQERQGQMIACPEEIAFNKGWASKARIKNGLHGYGNEYRDYVFNVLGSK